MLWHNVYFLFLLTAGEIASVELITDAEEQEDGGFLFDHDRSEPYSLTCITVGGKCSRYGKSTLNLVGLHTVCPNYNVYGVILFK